MSGFQRFRGEDELLLNRALQLYNERLDKTWGLTYCIGRLALLRVQFFFLLSTSLLYSISPCLRVPKSPRRTSSVPFAAVPKCIFQPYGFKVKRQGGIKRPK
ncbi:hypothetical protein [Scytonema sp. UIC 10036]|uniref:hypothetical protein n=1 Tax=Scytonema sp. UIC 10036 TaxID=2304196 RepID=UPI001A9A97EC|nr:hypothetical protein [Scytonema sp. UIC 10036]